MATTAMYVAAQQIILGLGGRPTNNGVNLLVAWMSKEDGDNSTLPCKNPMNSTLVMPGSHSINSKNVQCYADWNTGIRATIATINLSYYRTLLKAVKEGNVGLFFGSEGTAELGTWENGEKGSDPGYAAVIHSIYNGLPPVPAQYLTSPAPPAPKPKPGPIQQAIQYYEGLTPIEQVAIDGIAVASIALVAVGGYYLYRAYAMQK